MSDKRKEFYYSEHGSYCEISNHEFAEKVAGDIYSETKECLGGEMQIEIFTPPYENPRPIQIAVSRGALILHLTSISKEKKYIIGIEFGQLDEQNQPIRTSIDVEEWKNDLDNPFASDIYCANFDETFRAICMLGFMLQMSVSRIAYGAYS